MFLEFAKLIYEQKKLDETKTAFNAAKNFIDGTIDNIKQLSNVQIQPDIKAKACSNFKHATNIFLDIHASEFI